MSLLPMSLVLFSTLKLSPVIAASLVAIAPPLLAMLAELEATPSALVAMSAALVRT